MNNVIKNKLNIAITFLSVIILSKVDLVFAKINCEEQQKSDGIVYFLQEIYNMVLIIVPILIVVFSIIDFVKALTAQKADDMKKAYSNLVKRLIIGVIIIFLPPLINFTLNLFGQETCMWK